MTDVKQQKFNLEVVYECFSKCKKQDGEISIDQYAEGYEELCKFFGMFGTVFSFVMSEVSSKLEIMHHHRKSEVGPHYITVQSMVNYEVSNNLTQVKGKVPSGSRTLLRLHRALEFINLFLEKILETKEEEKLGGVASLAYNETLAKYHAWLIRKGVGLALYTLPTRGQLMSRMEGQSPERTAELLQQIIESIKPVYDTVQTVYSDNNILNLP